MAKAAKTTASSEVNDKINQATDKAKTGLAKLVSKIPGMGQAGPKRTAAERRKTLMLTAAGVLAGLAIFVIVFGVLVYKYKSDSKVTYNVARIIPYPVMKVGSSYVSYREYLFEVASIKQYYQSQPGTGTKVDFNTTAGKSKLKQLKQQVITQLKSDEVSRQLIAKNKIKVTDKQVKSQLAQITQSAGGDQKVRQVLAQYYGWTYDDLTRKVRFQLEKQALQKKITSDPKADAVAKAKATQILAEINAGGDFATLAKKYSQDSTAANGGDLGYFGKGQMDPTFEAAAFALQPGQVSGVVKSQYGYHIIKVLAKKDDQIDAAHILIQPVDFNQYMKAAVAAAKTHQYLKI